MSFSGAGYSTRAIGRLGVQVFAVALLAVGIAVVGLSGDAQAITSWFDDFDDGNATDGNPETWVPNELLEGDYDASSGDYEFKQPNPFTDEASMLATIDEVFADGSVRTRGFTTLDGNILIAARIDPDTVSGYVANIDAGGLLQLLAIAGGVPIDGDGVEWDPDDQDPVPENPLTSQEDVMIQIDTFGTVMSMTVWRPGELQPTEPNLTYESETFSSGVSGIAYKQDVPEAFGTFRFAKAAAVKLIDGDLDVNGQVDFDDIAGIVLALNDPAGYEATFGLAPVMQGDMDNNGRQDFDDISLFVARLTSGSATGATAAVPEPSSLLLALIAGMVACGAYRRR